MTSVFAHGPSRQQVVEEVIINAPVDKTWAIVGDFSTLHTWHPAIQSTEMQGDNMRVLSLGDDKKITEKLVKRDDEKMMLKYKIKDMTTIESFEFSGQQVDFYLPQAYLIIEIDGSSHDKGKDENRDQHTAKYGIETVRIQTKDLEQ